MADLRDIRGVEVVLVGLRGWAIFTGSEGDDPSFCGFFADRDDAEAAIALLDPDDAACPRFCDPVVVEAVLTEHGLVCSNDYECSHADIEKRVREWEATRG